MVDDKVIEELRDWAIAHAGAGCAVSAKVLAVLKEFDRYRKLARDMHNCDSADELEETASGRPRV